MKKSQQHTPGEIKKYNRAFIKFMKPDEKSKAITVNELHTTNRGNNMHELDNLRSVVNVAINKALEPTRAIRTQLEKGLEKQQNIRDQFTQKYSELIKTDWYGSTWPPNVVHIDMWDLVGGMSIEFSPGMYSDPDLSMKFWQLGVRYFKGVGKSKVYHFGSKSTGRVKRNKGKDTFLFKWGITSRFFIENYLQRGKDFKGELPDYKMTKLDLFTNWLKIIIRSF